MLCSILAIVSEVSFVVVYVSLTEGVLLNLTLAKSRLDNVATLASSFAM